jgi:hypothetical protein
MNFRNAFTFAAAMFPLLTTARSQIVHGPYIGGGTDINILESGNFQPGGTGVAAAGTISLGLRFGYGFREEIEGDNHESAFSCGCHICGDPEQPGGAMADAPRDFADVSPPVEPYIDRGVVGP